MRYLIILFILCGFSSLLSAQEGVAQEKKVVEPQWLVVPMTSAGHPYVSPKKPTDGQTLWITNPLATDPSKTVRTRIRIPQELRAVVSYDSRIQEALKELYQIPGYQAGSTKLNKVQLKLCLDYAKKHKKKWPILAEWAYRRVLIQDGYNQIAVKEIRKCMAKIDNKLRLVSPFKSEVHAFHDFTKHHQHKAWAIYAFDMGILKNKKSHNGSPRVSILKLKLKNYYGFGAKLYAPVDGVITHLVRDISDNSPGKIPPQARANKITIATANGYQVVLAHMKRNSTPMNLKVGQQITVGTLVGEIGNSGQSAMPHLHIHVADRDEVGYPIYWKDIEVKRGNSYKVQDTIKEKDYFRPVVTATKR